MTNRTKQEALKALLKHPLHKDIYEKTKGDLSLVTKHDCSLIAKNINEVCHKLSKEEKEKRFSHPDYNDISTETIYKWVTVGGSINHRNNTLLDIFFEKAETLLSSPIIAEENNTFMEGQMKNFVGKTYWSYNRLMGTADSFEYEGDIFSDMKNKISLSLVEFGNIVGNTIQVRRKNSMRSYEGLAKIVGNIMYIDLKVYENRQSFEVNQYMGRIDNLNILRFLRLCLVDDAPRAVREIMIKADDKVSYDTTVLKDAFCELTDLPAEVGSYLGDVSNAILTTKPLAKEDIIARTNSAFRYIENRWNLASLYLEEFSGLLTEAVNSSTISLDILDQTDMIHLYSKILEKMNETHALYATSLPSKEYLWKRETINALIQATVGFIERGGIVVRFFFVDTLEKEEISREEAAILLEHYKVYGNILNSGSAVYILNKPKLSGEQRQYIATEKKQGLISWEAALGNDNRIKKLWIYIKEAKATKYAKRFDYFEECAKKPEKQIARRIVDEDVLFWQNKYNL